jgi:hypothetical protein
VDYIEVPVLARINFGPPGPITPHLLVGPYAGFNVNAEAGVSGNGGSISGDISDEVRNTEFGGKAGLGLDFNVGLTKLSAQATYSLGFTSTFEDDSDDGEKNGVFGLTVGIWF